MAKGANCLLARLGVRARQTVERQVWSQEVGGHGLY